MRRDRLTIYFDGGCRPNPGPMETACVVRGVAYFRDGLGEGDNNIAEWLALRHALDLAIAAGAGDVLLIGDAATVVRQALGRSRCRSAPLLPHLAAFQRAAAAVPRLHLKQVRRSKNLAGIALERRRQ